MTMNDNLFTDDGDGDDIKGLETGLLVELEEVS